MGREVKRVALDFEWPLNKVWEGFINPYYKHHCNCPSCDGIGYSEDAIRLHEIWYGIAPFTPEHPYTSDNPIIQDCAQRNISRKDWNKHCGSSLQAEAERLTEHFNKQWKHHLSKDDVQALIDAGRLMDFTHRPRTPEQAARLKETGGYWMQESNGYVPTPKEVNDWSLCGLGHDSINTHACINARCVAQGIDPYCSTCKGDGNVWEDADGKTGQEWKQLAKDWESIAPPTGPGYQIWETVSEGSPVSPVFEKPEELARWMVDHHIRITRDTNYEGWLKFIKEEGWAPSMVIEDGQVKSGVAMGAF